MKTERLGREEQREREADLVTMNARRLKFHLHINTHSILIPCSYLAIPALL